MVEESVFGSAGGKGLVFYQNGWFWINYDKKKKKITRNHMKDNKDL